MSLRLIKNSMRISGLFFLFLLLPFSLCGDEKWQIKPLEFEPNPGRLEAMVFSKGEKWKHGRLLVYLHGCTEGLEEARNTGFEQEATKRNIMILYVLQKWSNNAAKCFNYFREIDQTTKTGEPVSIKTAIDTVRKSFSIQSPRSWIAGFSAGGYMSQTVVSLYPKEFDALLSIAGGPPFCASNFFLVESCINGRRKRSKEEWFESGRSRSVPNKLRVMLIHGRKDRIVHPNNFLWSGFYWSGFLGTKIKPDKAFRSGGNVIRTYSVAGDQKERMRRILLPEMPHAIPISSEKKCGIPKKYRYDSEFCAARAFFDWALDSH